MTIVETAETDAMTPDAETPAAALPTTALPTTALSTAPAPAPGWTRICRVDDLLVERGVAALVDGHQIALFRTFDGRIYATDQIDPFSGAAVLARGIVGDRAGVPTVASPMYKQVFDLRTGACLDTQGKAPLTVRVHPVAVSDGDVLVRIVPPVPAAEGDPR